MRFSSVWLTGLLAVSAIAAPAVLKASQSVSLSDSPTTGYATLNGGTTGGTGGSVVTVKTLEQLTAALADDTPKIVLVSGTITGSAQVRVGSNKSVIGQDSNAKLVGIGLFVNKKKNVIIRNLTIQKVLAANGDAIGIQQTTNVWIDHCDLSSDRDHDKDYYDGLLDLTHAADFVTISNTWLHDHWKASLVGHSDNNGAEDTGHLRVTYNNNYWSNINSRGPSLRFGTAHVYNNFYEKVSDGINTRQGAQVLVQSDAWVGSSKAVYSTDAGYATTEDNSYGGAEMSALVSQQSTVVPYKYELLGSANVQGAVAGTAGAKLSFSA